MSDIAVAVALPLFHGVLEVEIQLKDGMGLTRAEHL
jgi:hypothetical protein